MAPKNAEYPLKLVKALARAGGKSVQINSNAKDSARLDFQFDQTDILRAIRNIGDQDFYKSEMSIKRPGTYLDFYKTQYLGEDIYIHLYVKQISGKGILVINSFKQDTSKGSSS